MTIISLLVLCFYAYMQSAKLNDKPVTVETDIVTTGTREQFFDTDFVYSENLMYAFGLTAFDSYREPIEDPSIGVVKAYYESWSAKSVETRELPTRDCTEAELHINGKSDPKSAFFTPKQPADLLDYYHKKLKCLDTSSVQLYGDYWSSKAQALTIKFEKCDPSRNSRCRSEEEINQYLLGKYIMINMNQVKFSNFDYGDYKLSRYSNLEMITINTNQRDELVYKVQLTDLYLNYKQDQSSEQSADAKRVFQNIEVKGRPYNRYDTVQLSVRFELDLTLQKIFVHKVESET